MQAYLVSCSLMCANVNQNTKQLEETEHTVS